MPPCSVRTSLGQAFVEGWTASVARGSGSPAADPSHPPHPTVSRLSVARSEWMPTILGTAEHPFRRSPHRKQSACGEAAIVPKRGYGTSSSNMHMHVMKAFMSRFHDLRIAPPKRSWLLVPEAHSFIDLQPQTWLRQALTNPLLKPEKAAKRDSSLRSAAVPPQSRVLKSSPMRIQSDNCHYYSLGFSQGCF